MVPTFLKNYPIIFVEKVKTFFLLLPILGEEKDTKFGKFVVSY